MGCEMTRGHLKRKTISQDEKKDPQFQPSVEKIQVEDEHPEEALRWRPEMLHVPGKDISPAGRHAGISPMHAPNSAEDLQQAIKLQQDRQGDRRPVQSPNIFKAFQGLGLEDNVDTERPELIPTNAYNPLNPNPLNPNPTDAHGEIEGCSAGELLRIMQEAGAKPKYRHSEDRNVVQSPQALAEFGE